MELIKLEKSIILVLRSKREIAGLELRVQESKSYNHYRYKMVMLCYGKLGECEVCGRWYYLVCGGLTAKEAKNVKFHFICEDCNI